MSTENATGNIIPGEADETAKALGHMSKDEWTAKGKDPNEWVDAETYIKRGENIQSFMKKHNAHLSREIRELRGLIVEQRDMAQKARLQGYQLALQDIQQRQRDAAAQGDVDAFDAAERDKAKVSQQYQEASKVAPPPATEDPVFLEWVDDNAWYTDDADMAAYAEGVAQRLIAEGKTSPGRPILDEVTKRVKKAFAHKFTNPRREQPGAVETGSQSPTPKKSGKGFDDLPASAKSSFEKLEKNFKREGIAYTKEEYLANYVWE